MCALGIFCLYYMVQCSIGSVGTKFENQTKEEALQGFYDNKEIFTEVAEKLIKCEEYVTCYTVNRSEKKIDVEDLPEYLKADDRFMEQLVYILCDLKYEAIHSGGGSSVGFQKVEKRAFSAEIGYRRDSESIDTDALTRLDEHFYYFAGYRP